MEVKTNVKVSVIVPIYNAADYIEKTMDMLCRSLLKEIEIIAVNDGSTDNSYEKLIKCAKQDKRIRVINKSNGGIFEARNKGLEAAKGKYICFCDQDDVVEPQMYERMYRQIEKEQCDVAICSTGRCTDNIKTPYWVTEDTCYEKEDVIMHCFLPLVFNRSVLFKDDTMYNTIWKCMISKYLIKKYGISFRRYVNFEDDRLFLLDVLARSQKVVLLSDVLYYWRINPASESHAARYIKGLYQKDIRFQEATIEIMICAGTEEKYQALFRNINGAWRYSRIVENEVNHTGARFREKIYIIKKIYGETDFEDNVRMATFFPENMFIRKMVCRFLERRWPVGAYGVYKLYVVIRRKCQDKSFWIKAEKKAMKNTHLKRNKYSALGGVTAIAAEKKKNHTK